MGGKKKNLHVVMPVEKKLTVSLFQFLFKTSSSYKCISITFYTVIGRKEEGITERT